MSDSPRTEATLTKLRDQLIEERAAAQRAHVRAEDMAKRASELELQLATTRAAAEDMAERARERGAAKDREVSRLLIELHALRNPPPSKWRWEPSLQNPIVMAGFFVVIAMLLISAATFGRSHAYSWGATPDIRSLIDQSRKMGASDDQIRDLMVKAPFLAHKWQASDKAGIPRNDVFAHFGLSAPAPTPGDGASAQIAPATGRK